LQISRIYDLKKLDVLAGNFLRFTGSFWQNCKNEKSAVLAGNFSTCTFRVRDRNGKPGMRRAAPQAQRGK